MLSLNSAFPISDRGPGYNAKWAFKYLVFAKADWVIFTSSFREEKKQQQQQTK